MSEPLSPRQAPRRSLARGIASVVLRSILVLVVFASLLLVALFSFEQATLRPLAEFAVERLTGRTLRIEGELEAVAGRVVGLRAAGVSLANADWGSEEAMLSIGEAEITIDLAELLGGRYLIENLVVSDGRLLFEKNAAGIFNWAMGGPGERMPAGEDSPLPLALPVRHGQLSDIAITVIDPALTRPLDIELKRLVQATEVDQGLRASLDAEIDDRPLSLEMRIALPDESRGGAAIDFQAEAVFAATRLAADGNLDNPYQPRQVNLRMTLSAADISQSAEAFGLPALFTGATEIEARLMPVDNRHALEVTGSVGDLEIDVRARLNAIDTIDGISVELAAAAPDLAAAVRLPGPRQLPARAFSVDSKIALSGTRLEIGKSRVEVGNVRLTAEGVMSQFPDPEGSNLNLLLEGENFLDVAEMLQYSVPRGLKPGPFEVRADLDYDTRERQTFAIDLKVADLDGKFTGRIAGYPSFVGSSVDYRLAGQDVSLLQQWLAQPVRIGGAFRLEGQATRTATGFDVGASSLSLGENRIDFSGRVGDEPLRADTVLALHFEGPDLAEIAAIAGYTGFIPAGRAEIDVTAGTRDDGIQVDNLELRFARSQAKASGFVSLQPGLAGSIELAVKADDIADLLPPEMHAYVYTGQPFGMTGSFETGNGDLAINALQATLGAISLDASGRVAMRQPMRDAAFEVSVAGADLAMIVPAQVIPYRLPAQAFAFSGGVGFDDKGLALDELKAVIGSETLQVSASIPLDDPGEGLRLAFAASGSDIGILVPPEIDLYGIDSQPYEAAARVALDGGVLALRQLKFANPRGEVAGELSVSIENPSAFGKFDLVAKGDNLQSFLPALPSYQAAAEPFSLDARGGWSAERVEVERVVLAIDDSRIEVRGEVVLQPNRRSGRLVLAARGDSLADFGQPEGLIFPAEAFRVDATLEGDASKLSIPVLDLRLGESDLRGRVAIEFGEKPDIELVLESRVIDLSEIIVAKDEPVAGVEERGRVSADGRLIPDLPVPVEYLDRLNLVADIDLKELRFPRRVLNDVEFDASLQDGVLNVSRVRARGVRGDLTARFLAQAEGDRVITRGELEGKEIVLGEGKKLESGAVFPQQNLRIRFDTAGASGRELAANLNGYLQLTGAQGRLNNNYALGLFGSFFEDLLSTVNPFVTREPYTTISCFAAYAEIADGVATINPGAVLQTDKIDIYARGQLDLRSEEIRLRFDTAARKGIGVSLGDFVNPFVGVGGTLAYPRIGVDPKNAMFEGGFAVVTGGLSILLKSLHKRWFGSGSPCSDFATEAEKYLAERRQVQENVARPHQ
jgi:uncharacterized protein involved in outer membrane biogenesis